MIYSEDSANAACNAIVRLVDRAGRPGRLRLLNAKEETLCEIVLGFPAFSEAKGGSAFAKNLPLIGYGSRQAEGGQDITSYEVVDGDGVRLWSGPRPENLDPKIVPNQLVSLLVFEHKQADR